jgi:galactofuranose transport system substrate-binding protein
MINQRRLVVTGLAFAFAAGISNSSIAQELPKLKEKDTYKVGFSQTESNNPWRLAETESVKSEAAKRGFQLVYTDAAGSAAKQVADVNSMIAQGVDIILLAPREEKPLVPAVMAAKKAGIPVILLDRRVDPIAKPGRDYLTFIGSDFVEEGKRAADWLAKKTNGKATIIELEGTTGSSPANDRKQGFDWSG